MKKTNFKPSTELLRIKCLADRKVWIDKHGKRMKIEEMPNSYIENCMEWIRLNDNRGYYRVYLTVFENELKKRAKEREDQEIWMIR